MIDGLQARSRFEKRSSTSCVILFTCNHVEQVIRIAVINQATAFPLRTIEAWAKFGRWYTDSASTYSTSR